MKRAADELVGLFAVAITIAYVLLILGGYIK